MSGSVRVAYSGEPGAFAEDALIAFFGESATSLPVGSFGEVREALLGGRAEFGILPIENLVNGTVRETLDLVRDGALEIVGESVVPVNLVLAALPGVTIEEVTRVYSHAQALAQSEPFLRTRAWQLLSTYNTAGAGASIRERSERPRLVDLLRGRGPVRRLRAHVPQHGALRAGSASVVEHAIVRPDRWQPA